MLRYHLKVLVLVVVLVLVLVLVLLLLLLLLAAVGKEQCLLKSVTSQLPGSQGCWANPSVMRDAWSSISVN
eukprot:s1080_g17.t1